MRLRASPVRGCSNLPVRAARSGTCYIVGSNKVFKCCLCTPFYVAQRDKKGAFAIFVKNMDV